MPCAQQEGEEEAGDSELPDPATHSSFYGRWQTRAWAPPPAKVTAAGGRRSRQPASSLHAVT